jgi:short-subunit dehydrogenase
VYVVFGATGGIGSSLAELLAAQPGARLLLSGRSAEKLAALQSDVAAAAAAGDAEVATAAADPLDVQAVDQVIAEAVQRYGRVDGVANCVGSVLLKPGAA